MLFVAAPGPARGAVALHRMEHSAPGTTTAVGLLMSLRPMSLCDRLPRWGYDDTWEGCHQALGCLSRRRRRPYGRGDPKSSRRLAGTGARAGSAPHGQRSPSAARPKIRALRTCAAIPADSRSTVHAVTDKHLEVVMMIVRRLVRPAVVAALAAATLVSVGPASAAIDPASYLHVDVIRDYPGQSGQAGGYVSCPAGLKAVASGATSSGLRDVLTSGLTTFDGNGVFVTGRAHSPSRLEVSARCVTAAQVQGSTLATNLVRESGGVHTGRASCPPGTLAYGGGGVFSEPGGLPGTWPFGSRAVYASMPDANGTDWIFAAWGSLFPDLEMWTWTRCLPSGGFGHILTVTATEKTPGAVPAPGATLSSAARCPTGYYAYAGGAWWHHASSSTPALYGYLSVSNMTADDRGWFARGWTDTRGGALTATVQCMSTVSVVVPDALGSSKSVAGQQMSAAGLVPRFTGATTTPGAYVDSQAPAPGTSVAPGSTVTMHLRAEPSCGPNAC